MGTSEGMSVAFFLITASAIAAIQEGTIIRTASKLRVALVLKQRIVRKHFT